MDSEHTVREVVDLIVELGLVDQSTAGQTVQPDELDKPLSYYRDAPQQAVLSLLDHLGIRFAFDYKTFRGIEEADDDARLEWYEDVLQSIASCSRGSVTITNVRLVEDDENWELQFDCNGETEAWPVSPGDEDEDVEAAITFATYLPGIPADSLERFCSVDPPDVDLSGQAVFGDPEALNRLGAHFGLTFRA
ncbi:hypothetical protein OHA40_22770 [Nocardia sp. NBC_00508]|uniref:hypothetical protein n=1 Tax=Nocardia sp. NBC_00508 TaxID=2975992 RepID=UPI002E80BB6C|nr:hypothetical protein [Nocardia sp. NBC_00508]WUD64499.1 hypothetical protein OHA40_22770 [Nocardia sp. NBC_00508]